jgi:DNA-binding transcriptional regulator YdaS (Cro superfamily)
MSVTETSGIDRAIEIAGGQEALAASVGCTQQNVSFWKGQGYVPVLRAVEIEQATGVPRITLVDPRIRGVFETDVL